MKRNQILKRVCSPVLAGSMGAAVCLSGGGPALAVTGNIAATNSGTSNFGTGAIIMVCSSKATFFSAASGVFFGIGGSGKMSAPSHVGPVYVRSSGFTVGTSRDAYMRSAVNVNATGYADKFFAIRFRDAGAGNAIRYGWLHIVSHFAPQQIQIDTWGYNQTGGNIRTLSDTVTAKKLALSDGRLKLNWTSKNEQGVARYEVQARDAAGQWASLDSDAPGAGRYSTTVAPGVYRLVVEKVDGTVEVMAF